MRVWGLIALVGCGSAALDSGTTAGTDVLASPPELPAYGGTCPALVAGRNTIEVGGETREAAIRLPSDPEGAPVVFAWHFLSGDAETFVSWFALDGLTDRGAIVIAPESRRLPGVEWDTFEGQGSPDLKLFDALLNCAWQAWRVDLDRIHATGFSAGGLWTSTLTNRRSQWLASTAPFSGGATELDWSPRDPIPMLITWGGPSDTYGGFSFEDASNQLLAQAAGADQFAVRCVHASGHLPPPTGTGYAWDFFEAHPKGATSPWSAALPASMPAICDLP